MRETFFILAVIAVLFGLTALRYRKQIMAFVRFSRMLKEARSGDLSSNTGKREIEPKTLVKCSRCGTWVPEGRVRRSGAESFCSTECIKAARN
jgi:hypothetical protein